jgi:hypothetical protein
MPAQIVMPTKMMHRDIQRNAKIHVEDLHHQRHHYSYTS